MGTAQIRVASRRIWRPGHTSTAKGRHEWRLWPSPRHKPSKRGWSDVSSRLTEFGSEDSYEGDHFAGVAAKVVREGEASIGGLDAAFLGCFAAKL